MTHQTDDSILAIFNDFPDHQGCDESELVWTETELGITFPDYYRQIMLLDAHRLINTGMIIPPRQLPQYNRVLDDHIEPEPPIFALPQLVFAFDDIYATFAMDAVGGSDSPVYEFNDASAIKDPEPTRSHNSLRPFIAGILRRYFQL